MCYSMAKCWSLSKSTAPKALRVGLSFAPSEDVSWLTQTEIAERIHDYLRLHPTAGTKDNWIKGTGWDQSLLPAGMPSAADLPKDLYVALYRTDLHCVWVSPPVLALLPSPLPPSPPGGHIPTAGVFCDNAMDMLTPLMPPPTREQKRDFVLAAQDSLHGFGIVGVHDAGVVDDDRQLYSEMADARELKVRLYVMVECRVRNSFCPDEAAKVARDDGMLTVAAVKLFAGLFFSSSPPPAGARHR